MPSSLKTCDLKIPASFARVGYSARFLAASDQIAIFALIQACDDFFILSNGMPSVEGDARSLLSDHPPGISPGQKGVIGFFDSVNNLAAALDFMIGYPNENVWFIGLLLIHPDLRGRGWGKHIVSNFEAWSRANQGKALMIGVLECNTAAMRFWQANGFREIERTGPRVYGLCEHMVIRMRKDL